MFSLQTTEIETHGIARRFRLHLPSNTDFLLWEVEQDVFLDFFLLEEIQIPDSRGYLFYDSNNMPQTLELYKIGVVENTMFDQTTKTLWSFFDIEDFRFISLQLFTPRLRKFKFWKQHFGCFHNFFNRLVSRLVVTYFISFNLVGVGYFCEFLKPNIIKIVVSNTHDLIFFPPAGVCAGCKAVLNGDSTSFFFFSVNRQLLFNYVKTIRNSVKFNIYEYQGLLFSREKKIKKITKRKQK